MIAAVVHLADFDEIVAFRCVDIVAFAEVYTDVMDGSSEEDQVSRLEVVIAYPYAEFRLRAAIVWELDPEFPVDDEG
jgi:hypothetical protein